MYANIRNLAARLATVVQEKKPRFLQAVRSRVRFLSATLRYEHSAEKFIDAEPERRIHRDVHLAGRPLAKY